MAGSDPEKAAVAMHPGADSGRIPRIPPAFASSAKRSSWLLPGRIFTRSWAGGVM